MKSALGEIDRIVFRVPATAKGLLALCQHTNHGVETAFDCDFLTHRRLVAEQLLPGVVAQNAHMCRPLVVVVGIQAALLQGQICHIGNFCGRAFQHGSRRLLALVLHAYGAHAELPRMLVGAVGGNHVGQGAQGQHVIHGQLLPR